MQVGVPSLRKENGVLVKINVIELRFRQGSLFLTEIIMSR